MGKILGIILSLVFVSCGSIIPKGSELTEVPPLIGQATGLVYVGRFKGYDLYKSGYSGYQFPVEEGKIDETDADSVFQRLKDLREEANIINDEILRLSITLKGLMK